jgi:hypothetical protein
LVDDTDPSNPVVNLPYKELVFTYTSNDSTDDGTAVILQNDFVGTPVITRGGSGSGYVVVTFTGKFTVGKTIANCLVTGDDNATALFVNGITTGIDAINFFISNSSAIPFEGTLGNVATPNSTFCSFFIRVYP